MNAQNSLEPIRIFLHLSGEKWRKHPILLKSDCYSEYISEYWSGLSLIQKVEVLSHDLNPVQPSVGITSNNFK